MRRYLMTALFVALTPTAFADPPPAPAQKPPPNYGCPGAEYRQFDFWLGKWSVTTTKGGQPAGSSEVTLLDKGCIVFESWTGANGSSGHSLNVFDQADGRWHQTWIDVTGDQVHDIGDWKDGAIRFAADDITTPQRTPARMTMTFEPRPDGTVLQSGTLSTDGGKTFQASFDLIYTPMK